MLSAIFSSEDREFMDAVKSDLNLFIEGNSFKSVKALKTLQETTKNHQTADRNNKTHSKIEMIEKDVSKPKNVTANIYRPPGARSAASTSDPKRDDFHSKENRRSKVRRPDLQVYVPRPKRVSYGEVEKNRFTEDEDTSAKPTPSCLQGRRKSLSNPARKTNLDGVDRVLPTHDITPSEDCEMLSVEQICNDSQSSYKNKNSENGLKIQNSTLDNQPPDLLNENCVVEYTSAFEKEEKPSFFENTNKSAEMSSVGLVKDVVLDTIPVLSNETNFTLEKQISEVEFTSDVDSNNLEKKREFSSSTKSENKSVTSTLGDDNNILTISDDSQTMSVNDDIISISSTVTESSYDSTDSSDSSLKTKSVKKCKQGKYVKDSSTDKNVIRRQIKKQSSSFERKDDEKDFNPEERNLKNRRILHGKPESDVLIISDAVKPTPKVQNNLSKKDDKLPENDSTTEKPQQSLKKVADKSNETDLSTHSTYDPNDYDWDALFTDEGECLVPGFMEELTKNVGRVKITTAKSDYRPYQTEDERIGDGECIIEIYNFPAEFKTNDLLNVFAAYRNRSFHIKWVDDTHALGVFGSPLVADEVLATNLPFVKTRPLRLAIAESRIKARGLALPPMERPKTCPALARRLVTGALGLRLPTASKEREAERLVLKEAREKRRLDLKQKEAVWEGNFN